VTDRAVQCGGIALPRTHRCGLPLLSPQRDRGRTIGGSSDRRAEDTVGFRLRPRPRPSGEHWQAGMVHAVL